MRVLKGAEVSAKIKEEVQAALAKCKGAAPKLAIIRVGENPDDMSYERGATKKMENFGLRVQSYVYPADITDADFKADEKYMQMFTLMISRQSSQRSMRTRM